MDAPSHGRAKTGPRSAHRAPEAGWLASSRAAALRTFARLTPSRHGLRRFAPLPGSPSVAHYPDSPTTVDTGRLAWSIMSEQPREFGRDGVSGLVDKDRALRARLLPRREDQSSERPNATPITTGTTIPTATHIGQK